MNERNRIKRPIDRDTEINKMRTSSAAPELQSVFESNPNRVTFHAYRLRRKLYKVYYDETNLSGGTKSIQFRAFQSIFASNYEVPGR